MTNPVEPIVTYVDDEGRSYTTLPVLPFDDRKYGDPCTGCAFRNNPGRCHAAPDCMVEDIVFVQVKGLRREHDEG